MCDDRPVAANHGKDLSFGTKLVHSGHHPDEWTYRDVISPISISTIYNAESPGVIKVNLSFNCVRLFFFFIVNFTGKYEQGFVFPEGGNKPLLSIKQIDDIAAVTALETSRRPKEG